MKLSFPLLAVATALTLGGCQTMQPPVQSIRQLAAPVVPTPTPPVLDDYSVRVYNIAQLEKLVADAKAKNEEVIIVALTPEGYKTLVSNMLEVERYIKEQRAVIAFLKKTLDSRENIQINK